MMVNKLKPCPFCGGEAEFTVKSKVTNNTKIGFSYSIVCSKCNCTPTNKSEEIYVFLAKNGEIKITEASLIAKQSLIDLWNTRHNEKEGADNDRA